MAKKLTKKQVETWKKRWTSAVSGNKRWREESEVDRCYAYWHGEQLASKTDKFGQRIAQVNKIHPEVRNNIPSIYYYRPFARLTAAPEYVDDPGSSIEADTQVLQDTVNHLIRDPEVQYRDATFLGLKEAHWALGLVEVGYSAEFTEAPSAEKPPLKETKKTEIAKSETYEEEVPVPADEMMVGDPELDAAMEELAELQRSMLAERFYVKHIPADQVMISASDKPILTNNDWVGYWEDMPLEDVKRAPGYQHTKDLKAAVGLRDDGKDEGKEAEEQGEISKVRLYKIWDLRTKTRYVFAEGHDRELLCKPFRRCPLKFLRFDIDPYHFYPRPLLLSKLGPQDEYNDSREYLRKVRKGTVPRYTYDEDAVESKQMEKLESGEMGTYIPRRAGTSQVIEPVNQPSFSENAIQTLTLSDKEFTDVGGVGGDARVTQSSTATQAKIAETKSQVQDNFDRLVVAEWLADIARELLALAIENMSSDRWVAMNVAPDAMYAAPELGQQVQATYQRVNADLLAASSAGISWDVQIDIDSLSPVSEEERFQKWMQGLGLLGNPVLARLFSVSPPLLIQTLKYMGLRSANDQQMILQSMQAVVQMEAQLAAQGQNAAPGVSPQGGSGRAGNPKPAGGPQPGGPRGPGGSAPKQLAGGKPSA